MVKDVVIDLQGKTSVVVPFNRSDVLRGVTVNFHVDASGWASQDVESLVTSLYSLNLDVADHSGYNRKLYFRAIHAGFDTYDVTNNYTEITITLVLDQALKLRNVKSLKLELSGMVQSDEFKAIVRFYKQGR